MSGLWGADDVNAIINYKNGKAIFNSKIHRKSDVDIQSLQYAEEHLAKKYNEIAGGFED